MTNKTRNILIVFGLVLLTFAGIVGYGIYSVYSFFSEMGSNQNKPLPKDIEQARILKGKEFLKKTEIFKVGEMSFLETIKEASKEKDEKKKHSKTFGETAKSIFGFDDIKTCGDEIIAVGKFGGYVFDKDGKTKREINFEPREIKVKILFFDHTNYQPTVDNLLIVDLENDGRCEFISHSSTDGMTIFDSNGNVYWRYGERNIDLWNAQTEEEEKKEVYVTGVDVGDLDNDGISEIIISQKNDGIRAFTKDKKEIWHQYDEFPVADFRFIDIDGDGSNELLEFQGGSSQLRDTKTGEVTKKIELDGITDDVFQAPIDKDGKSIVQTYKIYENELTISDLENNAFLKAEAPLSEVKESPTENEGKNAEPTPPSVEPIITEDGVEIRAAPVGVGFDSYSNDTASIYEPRAVWVKLKKDEPKYFAVLGAFIMYPRANFYVYQSDGKLVYHELLPEEAETIAILPKDNELEEILIGGKDTIWQFAIK